MIHMTLKTAKAQLVLKARVRVYETLKRQSNGTFNPRQSYHIVKVFKNEDGTLKEVTLGVVTEATGKKLVALCNGKRAVYTNGSLNYREHWAIGGIIRE